MLHGSFFSLWLLACQCLVPTWAFFGFSLVPSWAAFVCWSVNSWWCNGHLINFPGGIWHKLNPDGLWLLHFPEIIRCFVISIFWVCAHRWHTRRYTRTTNTHTPCGTKHQHIQTHSNTQTHIHYAIDGVRQRESESRMPGQLYIFSLRLLYNC